MNTIVPQSVLTLIARFERNRETYQANTYNETQLRREFIDPFFAALGWDVDNTQGFAEAYKDVIHEDAIKIAGATKAPDYCFRIGGARKFFVEAKKPSVNLKDDASPAFQLRRYAWSAKLPLSILTDFEEFAVYDCRVKPSQTDKPSVGRTLYFNYQEYPARWAEIANIFSKDAVLKGSFDKYAETNKAKKGTAEVDAAFLREIETWRELLAKNIAQRNPKLTQRELNFSVQRTIDRIIFLRICEDRGMEIYGQLQALLNGERIYARLCNLFHHADERYNSGIFHFQQEKDRGEAPDELTLALQIEDKPLKEIIRNLYYPESPYEFSVLPADILGQVYEQFLGKVIRLTSGHRAVVEDKPEVKKAGGVYYTPTYIVDYIVQNTVGKLLEGKTPKQVAKLRVLDPACGSGSFLLGAYQYLLDWHRDWYVKNEPEKHAASKRPALYQAAKNDWRLTTAERKRILLSNIFGVDIDPQAVEVTKLSLLLKVLEGENEQTIAQQLKFFHERALPDLGHNIKCGNSLIGHDFYEQQINLLDDAERLRINAFDWQTEFAEIMQAGGFDAVIGNPPYISVEGTFKDITDYYLKVFDSAYGRVNSFSLFLEKALGLLIKNGYCGFITSNRVLTNAQLDKLRKLLLEKSTIDHVLSFKKAVFAAAVDTTVIIFRNCPPTDEHAVEINFDIGDLANGDFRTNKANQLAFIQSPAYVFNVKQQGRFSGLIQKIKRDTDNLDKFCQVRDGVILGSIKDLFLSNKRLDKRYEKWLEGNEVSRYYLEWKGRYICYDNSLLEKELQRKREKAKSKAVTPTDFKKLSSSGIRLRTPEIFRKEKILTRQNAKRLIGVFDDEKYFVKNSLHCIFLQDGSNYNLKYFLGLINSRLIDFYFQDQIGGTGEIFSQMKIAYIEKLPIHKINFSDPADKSRHDRMVELVERMLALHQQLAAAKLEHEQTALKRQIAATDRQIDNLVYELYGLSEQEIKIVEGQS